MTIEITAVHKEDAWYPDRDEVIGATGKVKGAIVDNGGWFGLTILARGVEIGFAFCRFEVVG